MPDNRDPPLPSFPAQDAALAQVLRIVDAAANRAAEGLRVVEDYLRFVLDDVHLTGLVKGLRHELAGAIQEIPSSWRHRVRQTEADVGTSISTVAEGSRTSAAEVAAASFKRLEQSLRSLEEYGKIASPTWAARIEQLRYRVYTLEKAVGISHTSRERLAGTRLYVLVEGCPSPSQYSGLVARLVRAGVHALQLRDKNLADRELIERARQLRQQTRGTQTLAIINDRPDIAALCDADGVHVGQEELSVKDARTIVGPRALVGLSTHSIEQARAAVIEGADYIGVGPTFPSGTKHFDQFPGLDLVAAVAREIRLPAFAIGGITTQNVAQVREAGLTRVAVGAAVTGAADIEAAVRQFLDQLAD